MNRGKPLQRTAFKTKREGPSFHVEPRPRADAKPAFKPRACEWEKCGKTFTPTRPMQSICSPRCATARAVAQVAAKQAAERQQDRTQREANKGLRELLAEAQTAFNAFIRARDAGKPCICCGKPFEPQKPGGSMDAGHYLARSIAPQHRFNEDNVFGQRKNCNRPGGAKRGAFRDGVISRTSLARVEALEADTDVHKWTKGEAREIRETYRAKPKALPKGSM